MPNQNRPPQLWASEEPVFLFQPATRMPKGTLAMGKYLILWELDPARMPVDPKERAMGWKLFMDLVKKDLQTGTAKDWGAFVGESAGYVIHEGTELEVGLALQQFVPFAKYTTHPISSVAQVDELIEAMQA